MMVLAGSVFVASLLGSMHCGAMCGPLVAFYSGEAKGRPAWPRHLAYNLGRLASYLVLGVIAGTLGAALNLASTRLVGMNRLAAVASSVLLVAWGALRLLDLFGVPIARSLLTRHLQKHVTRLLAPVRRLPPMSRALLLGLLTTLLPCGWLYAFVLTAAGAGSPAAGALTMAVFWLGTLPVLVAVGAGVQRLLGGIERRWLTMASLVVVMSVGLVGLVHRSGITASAPAAGSCHEHR